MKLWSWIKHFLVYGLGIVLMNLLPALMIPIYTYRVPPSIFGVLEILNRSQEILLLIFSFGLRSSLLTFYQMAKEQPGRQKTVYSTALQFLGTFGFVLIIFMMLAAGMWSQLLFGSDNYRHAVLLILVGTYFEMIFQMAVLHLQSELRSVLYVSIFTSRAVFAIVLNLILVYWLRLGLMGILWATIIHTVLYAIALVIIMFRSTGFRFDRTVLWQMLCFGAPVMIGALASFALNNGDRYFLNHYATQAEVGIYGLGYKIGGLSMALVLMPFGKIWSVTMVDISERPNGPSELGRIATYLILGTMFSTLGFSLLGPYLIRFFSERSYWDAYRVVPLVGFAYIFYAWTTIMDASFYVTKRTVYKTYSIFIAGGICCCLYYLLIPRFGMMGAAWATLGGYISFAVTTAFFAQRVYPVRYQLRRLSVLFIAGAAFCVFGSLIPITPLITGFALRATLVLMFPVLLWVSGFFSTEEEKVILDYWNIAKQFVAQRLKAKPVLKPSS